LLDLFIVQIQNLDTDKSNSELERLIPSIKIRLLQVQILILSFFCKDNKRRRRRNL